MSEARVRVESDRQPDGGAGVRIESAAERARKNAGEREPAQPRRKNKTKKGLDLDEANSKKQQPPEGERSIEVECPPRHVRNAKLVVTPWVPES